MKTKFSIAGFVFLILLGVFLVFRYGMAPQTIEVMTPSFFDRPEELGAVVFRTLYDPLKTEPVVIFAVPPSPQFQQNILGGFLEAARTEKAPYTLVLKEPSWSDPKLTGGAKVVAFDFNQEDMTEVVRSVRTAIEHGDRIVIYTVSISGTHLIKNNALNRFEAAWGEPVTAITTGPLPLNFAQEGLVDPPCIGEMRDMQGLYPLGCAMLRSAREIYRKHLTNKRFVGIMNQDGLKDYLVQVTGPGADEAKPFTLPQQVSPPAPTQ